MLRTSCAAGQAPGVVFPAAVLRLGGALGAFASFNDSAIVTSDANGVRKSCEIEASREFRRRSLVSS